MSFCGVFCNSFSTHKFLQAAMQAGWAFAVPGFHEGFIGTFPRL